MNGNTTASWSIFLSFGSSEKSRFGIAIIYVHSQTKVTTGLFRNLKTQSQLVLQAREARFIVL